MVKLDSQKNPLFPHTQFAPVQFYVVCELYSTSLALQSTATTISVATVFVELEWGCLTSGRQQWKVDRRREKTFRNCAPAMNGDQTCRRAYCAWCGEVSSLLLVLMLAILSSTVESFGSTNGKKVHANKAASWTDSYYSTTDNTGDGSIVLPIFPLRKRVRLPTEQLTLNLYEERYLALAEYVLQPPSHEPCWCGALYASDQPQIVTQGGMGPIVPMITPGQIGVVCWVHDHSEAHVPTVGGDQLRRRIRLNLIATHRFQIQRVLHNGFGGGFVAEKKGSNNEGPTTSAALPFILVEAQLIRDRDDDSSLLCSLVDRATAATNQDLLLRRFMSKHPSLPLPSVAELYSFRLAARELDETASQKRLACLQARSALARLQQFE